jgi:hypothetical protein
MRAPGVLCALFAELAEVARVEDEPEDLLADADEAEAETEINRSDEAHRAPKIVAFISFFTSQYRVLRWLGPTQPFALAWPLSVTTFAQSTQAVSRNLYCTG